jgi:hypothetical protein
MLNFFVQCFSNREATAMGRSPGGGGKEKTWKHRIDDVMDDAADGLGHVLLHSAGFCIGGLVLLGLMFH